MAVQRRGLEPRRPPRARVSTLRRELRAGGFDVVHVHEPVAPIDRLGRPDERRRAACRDVPLLLGVRPAAQDRGADRRPPQAQPPAGADRGLRGRGLDRAALLRRALPGHPERRRRCPRAGRRAPRRARARASRCGSRSSARPSSARACPCCCAPSRRCAREVPAELMVDRLHRRRAGAAARRGRGRDRARARRRRRQGAPAARRRPAVRAVARRRVLRHGPDRGVRRRHAGRGLRHRRLPRRRRATACDGLLVPRGDATGWPRRCATWRNDPARVERARGQRGRAAPSATRGRGSPSRSSSAYEDARAVPQPETRRERAAVKIGAAPRRRPAARPRAAAAVARARARRRRAAAAGARAALLGGAGAGDGVGSVPGGRAHRAGPDRRLARALEPAVGAVRRWR